MKRSIILVIFSITAMACGGDNQQEEQGCTTELVPGIVIEIRDAVSDAPIAENAVVVITDGDYQETLTVSAYEGPDPSSAYAVAGAYERPGIYDIELNLAGYESWFRTQVEVEAGVCHVNTVTFTVRLSAIQ